MLVGPVSPLEINNALFAIDSLKSPGFEGFPALFYQTHWSLCGDEITNWISTAFMKDQVP